MTNFFLAPAFLGFLGLVPIVILLYILKLKRTPVIISSTMLWFKSLQDLTANAPFQRLRRNLLLFLQILILVALALALARPFVRAEGRPGKNICLLIDNSASMSTVETDGFSRLEIAKEKALEMVDAMRGGDNMMVVSFGGKSDVRCELTGNRHELRQAIASISPSAGATRIRDAAIVARSLRGETREQPVVADLRIVIMSDGRIEDIQTLAEYDFDADFLQIGGTSDNAGIVSFSVRNPTDGSEGQRQCFLLVHNESKSELNTTLTLYFNDEIVAVEEVVAAPGDQAELVFGLGDTDVGVLRAELDHEDAMADDNSAWLALRPDSTIKVLLVGVDGTTSMEFFKRVLGLEPRADVSAVSPDGYYPTNEFDLVLFNAFVPETLPESTMIFFNAVPKMDGVALGEIIERPPVLSFDKEHPLMRFINPSTIAIGKARRLTVPADAQPLMSTEGAPLITDLSRTGRQIAVVAFDPAESNWPWHLSFPLFMQNALSWVPRATLSGETSVAAGRPITIMPNPQATVATVTSPSGDATEVELNPTRPVFFGGTQSLGIYTVETAGEETPFAVNLLNFEESHITPAESIKLGGAEVEADKGTVKQNRELWRWLVLAAIGVLMLEWWIYARRAWL